MFLRISFLLLCSISCYASLAVHVLGCGGGSSELDCSSYLVNQVGSDEYIVFDGGSMLQGYTLCQKNGHLDPKLSFTEFMHEHIKAYFVSHAHLDHLSALILHSQEDNPKGLYGIDSTINDLREYVFNWHIWPNFGSEGTYPIGLYEYKRIQPGKIYFVENTPFTVTPYVLSHPGDHESSAFLIEAEGEYLLYFGDTSPDAIEKVKRLDSIWSQIAPFIERGILKGIFLECSYPAGRPPSELFGHLDTTHFIKELSSLALKVNPDNPESALTGLNIIVTHMKGGEAQFAQIENELGKESLFGVHLIFAKQGEKIILD